MGDLAEGFADEAWPLNPSSPYSASKAAGDLLIRAYGRTYGVRYKIVRPSNNYGPYQHPEKLIPRTVIRLLLGRPATIYGDGSQIRDWLYVGDFVRGLEAVVERGEERGVYNLCAGQFASVKEVVSSIASIMGRPDAVVYTRGRPGEDMRYAMRCDRARGLGWSPATQLPEGLRKTVEWYVANERWWRPVLDEYALADIPWR
jgi:dTDP-glucose 4,6-dehydratase